MSIDNASKLYELENELKKIEEVEEAIVCGEGKPFEELYKIKARYLADKDELEYTATMKVKKKEVIKKFQGVIDTLTSM